MFSEESKALTSARDILKKKPSTRPNGLDRERKRRKTFGEGRSFYILDQERRRKRKKTFGQEGKREREEDKDENILENE